MKLNTVAAVVVAFIVCSCGPIYEEEGPGRGGVLFFAIPSESFDSPSERSLVLLETSSLRKCSEGVGSASAILIYRIKREGFEKFTREFKCAVIKPVFPEQLQVVFGLTKHLVEGVSLPAPERPVVNQGNGLLRVPIKMVEKFHLFFSMDEIQIIKGSYGNRGGLETEHTYGITLIGGKRVFRTVRFLSRKCAYDRFSDW